MSFRASPAVRIPIPTYNGRHDGHYEAVEVTYDPAVVSYQELLDTPREHLRTCGNMSHHVAKKCNMRLRPFWSRIKRLRVTWDL